MGTEEIIHGHRHGEMYSSFSSLTPEQQPKGEEPVPVGTETLHSYWPSSVIVDSHPGGEGVFVAVQAYDQDTGLPGDTMADRIGTTLDRAGCNRLIAAVRKHRDKHFGKDQ